MKNIYILIVALLITAVNVYGQQNTQISFQEQVSQSADSTIIVDLTFDKTQFQSPIEFFISVVNQSNEQVTGALIRINEISGVEIVEGSVFSQDDEFYYFKLKSLEENKPYNLIFSVKPENGSRQILNTQKTWRIDND